MYLEKRQNTNQNFKLEKKQNTKTENTKFWNKLELQFTNQNFKKFNCRKLQNQNFLNNRILQFVFTNLKNQNLIYKNCKIRIKVCLAKIHCNSEKLKKETHLNSDWINVFFREI